MTTPVVPDAPGWWWLADSEVDDAPVPTLVYAHPGGSLYARWRSSLAAPVTDVPHVWLGPVTSLDKARELRRELAALRGELEDINADVDTLQDTVSEQRRRLDDFARLHLALAELCIELDALDHLPGVRRSGSQRASIRRALPDAPTWLGIADVLLDRARAVKR